MEKQFNTAGPMVRPDFYKVDPLTRWDMENILDLIRRERYFILHAPRQTGKTTCMFALRDYLNEEGKYFAIYTNVEIGQGSRNNVERALKVIASSLINDIELMIGDTMGLKKTFHEMLPNILPEIFMEEVFKFICQQIKKPIVLMIDEVDALVGDTLITFLRQIRKGYNNRPENFPSSIILCGLRDIQDYRIQTSGQEIITGGSAFNIKTKSLRLGNFSKEDVLNLYSQHTKETGQIFHDGCYDLIMEFTDGQPLLVNAIANEVTFEMKENRDRSVVITPAMIAEAKERLILERQTHIDQLLHKLREDRVRRVILPMLLGETIDLLYDDVSYCIDLGLIKKTKDGLQIANKIYQEIIPREITLSRQNTFEVTFKPDWVNTDGSLNMKTLLTLFKEYWNENASLWSEDIAGYKEAAPQLVTQAFLQRVANGNGSIDREYAIGNKRVDILLKWKYTLSEDQWQYQSIILEIKTINKEQKYSSVIEKALKQTTEYAQTCGQNKAYILIFDRDNSQKWKANQPFETVDYHGTTIEIWKFTQKISKSKKREIA
jgi:hypothetical protein